MMKTYKWNEMHVKETDEMKQKADSRDEVKQNEMSY